MCENSASNTGKNKIPLLFCRGVGMGWNLFGCRKKSFCNPECFTESNRSCRANLFDFHAVASDSACWVLLEGLGSLPKRNMPYRGGDKNATASVLVRDCAPLSVQWHPDGLDMIFSGAEQAFR